MKGSVVWSLNVSLCGVRAIPCLRGQQEPRWYIPIIVCWVVNCVYCLTCGVTWVSKDLYPESRAEIHFVPITSPQTTMYEIISRLILREFTSTQNIHEVVSFYTVRHPRKPKKKFRHFFILMFIFHDIWLPRCAAGCKSSEGRRREC